MTRSRGIAAALCAVGIVMTIGLTSGPAHAKCKNFEGYHNGTNLFHETGAKGAAINHLLTQVEQWKRDNGITKVRMSRVKTHCGKPFTKYLLTHIRCTAKARVCH